MIAGCDDDEVARPAASRRVTMASSSYTASSPWARAWSARNRSRGTAAKAAATGSLRT